MVSHYSVITYPARSSESRTARRAVPPFREAVREHSYYYDDYQMLINIITTISLVIIIISIIIIIIGIIVLLLLLTIICSTERTLSVSIISIFEFSI